MLIRPAADPTLSTVETAAERRRVGPDDADQPVLAGGGRVAGDDRARARGVQGGDQLDQGGVALGGVLTGEARRR